MLNTIVLEKTTEEIILSFFAEKFDCKNGVASSLLAIHEWYYIPRTKILTYKQMVSVKRAVHKFNRTGQLPQEYYRAYAYAGSSKCHAVEELYERKN